MPRPELYPIKKLVGFDAALMQKVEKWRAKQQPLPNLSEAIRQLVELALSQTATGRPSRKAARSARSAAGSTLDHLADKTASAGEQASRKRRLLKGPREFRAVRKDHAR